MFVNTKNDEEKGGTQDIMVIFSTDGTAEIAPIVEITEERVLAVGEVEYAVPLGDLKVYIGRRGRIFSYKAIEENITDSKRLAALERSIVLRQITMFEKEARPTENKLPMGKMILIGAGIVLMIIILAVR
jgi:hypothetical protein